MRASELIAQLEELVERWGDLEVKIADSYQDLEPVTHADVYGGHIQLDAE